MHSSHSTKSLNFQLGMRPLSHPPCPHRTVFSPSSPRSRDSTAAAYLTGVNISDPCDFSVTPLKKTKLYSLLSTWPSSPGLQCRCGGRSYNSQEESHALSQGNEMKRGRIPSDCDATTPNLDYLRSF